MPLGDRIRRLRGEGRGKGLIPAVALQPQLSSRQLLSELEQRYQIGLWFWDYRSKTLDWDAGMRRMNGLAVDAPLPLSDVMRRQFPSEDPWIMESVIKHALPVSAWVNVINCEDGSEIHHLCNVNIIKDERGEPDLAIGFVQDITMYKRREELLEAYRLSDKARFEGQGVVSWCARPDGKIITNSGLAEITGFSPEDLANDSILQAIYPADRAKIAKWKSNVHLKSPHPLTTRIRIRKFDGDYISYEACASVLQLSRQRRRLESWTCIPETLATAEVATAQLSPQLLRGARALLGWTVQTLSDRSNVSAATIARYESGSRLRSSSCESLLAALNQAGISLEKKADGALSLHYKPHP